MASSRELDDELFVQQSDEYDSDCIFLSEAKVTRKNLPSRSHPDIKMEPDGALQTPAVEQISTILTPSREDSHVASRTAPRESNMEHCPMTTEGRRGVDYLFGESLDEDPTDEDPTLHVKSEALELTIGEYPVVEQGATEEEGEAGSRPNLSSLQHLGNLLSNGSESQLAAGVKIGLQILDCLEMPITETQDAAMIPKWLDTMAKLRDQTKRERTVVAVVGSTGAGKSSLINAVLDEERILPTNGQRACTSVITEISYNDSADPDERYRAEVEAISMEEWKQELRILYDELVDPDGGDSDAVAVAWAKFKAVYPKKTHTKNAVSSLNFEDLINEPEIVTFLGTVRNVCAAAPKVFCTEMQAYLDSKDKQGASKDDSNNMAMAFWPLIKVVRIYVKADALSTGVVLVDLVSFPCRRFWAHPIRPTPMIIPLPSLETTACAVSEATSVASVLSSC